MPERLVAGRPAPGADGAVLAEHQQRCAGRRADRGQLPGQSVFPVSTVVFNDIAPMATSVLSTGVTPASTTVSLGAPVSIGLIVLAVALALAGGLLSGAVGALRAARLRPAEALRSVE